MKHAHSTYLFVALIALSLAAPSIVSAQAPRIGYVNVAKLLKEAPQTRDAGERIRGEFSPRRDELADCENDVEDMSNRLRRDRSRLGEVARERLDRQITKLKRSCRRLHDDLREDLNARHKKELAALETLLEGIIEDLAEDGQFDLILSGAALHVSDRVDLTDDVLNILKRRNSGGSSERR